ncbi:hypothetical protein PTTG_06239 [Puccinia triticina 1-1 BBBD Race 1]|uniref:Uncharacterized protein n=1 Tax=Puccinia triticina (isolate 1-1 / race 1 (BBBD)) TaxID=630390 RepID=A0A180GM84_PUCT1|nr:hypothetical protein PTTG_06239 [Puccinia triticina 1-1 BBBD Race 1]
MLANEDTPFSLRPPPWFLQGEGWWIILSILGPARKILDRLKHHQREKTKRPDSTHSDSLELLSREVSQPSDGFRGGFGSVQILRYHMSPVGAYDELLLIPGVFKPPEQSSKRSPVFRITEIYVSTLGSILNGRHNWNIPKKLARFEFIPLEGSPNKITVKVYALKSFSFTRSASSTSWCFEPQFFETPFFSMIIQRRLASVNIPINLGHVPMLDLTLLQPPLQAADPLQPNILELNRGAIGTSDWKRTKLDIRGRCGLCSFKGTLPGRAGQFADGEHFPDIQPYRFGFHFPRLHLQVQAPTHIPSSSDPSEKQ